MKEVICIDDDFEWYDTFTCQKTLGPPSQPKKGDILKPIEQRRIQGTDVFRFAEHDNLPVVNWFDVKNFADIDEISESIEIALKANNPDEKYLTEEEKELYTRKMLK